MPILLSSKYIFNHENLGDNSIIKAEVNLKIERK